MTHPPRRTSDGQRSNQMEAGRTPTTPDEQALPEHVDSGLAEQQLLVVDHLEDRLKGPRDMLRKLDRPVLHQHHEDQCRREALQVVADRAVLKPLERLFGVSRHEALRHGRAGQVRSELAERGAGRDHDVAVVAERG